MNSPQNKNLDWAEENGYEYQAGQAGSSRDHVLGIDRNRLFEIVDMRVEVPSDGEVYSVWQTIVVIPTAGVNLPSFDLVARREAGALSFVGIKGLELKLAATAPLDDQRLLEAFNNNYFLFGGGVRRALAASPQSTDEPVPSPAEMASICKPSVLRFLATAVTGSIEVRKGCLTMRAPQTRIIGPGVSDTILEGRERESLLTVANDLLDVLANAASEAPLPGLTVENNFRPAELLGSVLGGVLGFVLGGFVGLLSLFLLDEKQLLLVPGLALGGAALGCFLGKTVWAFPGGVGGPTDRLRPLRAGRLDA